MINLKIAGSFLQIQDDKKKIDILNDVCDIVHYDIMDGKFSSHATLSSDEIIFNTKGVNRVKDIHLMVLDIKKYVDEYSIINPDYITFHYEATSSLDDIIKYIKSKNIKVGIAINPKTDVSVLKPYLSEIDLVLVMSVQAGAGGQPFIDISDKIDYLFNVRLEHNYNYLIEVDGGINDDTIGKVSKADIAVIGSFITASDDYGKMVNVIRKKLNGGFTLIELLGVLMILAILASVAFIAISGSIRNGKVKACKTQEATIIEAAKMYFTDNSTVTEVKVSVLKSKGYLDNDIKSPMTGKAYNNNTKVNLSIINGSKYEYLISYGNSAEKCT